MLMTSSMYLKRDKIVTGDSRELQVKNNDIENPSNYMGARLKQKSPDVYPVLSLTCVDSFNDSVNNLEESIRGTSSKFPIKEILPMMKTYELELYITIFQESNGVLIWATKIGRTDIIYGV